MSRKFGAAVLALVKVDHPRGVGHALVFEGQHTRQENGLPLPQKISSAMGRTIPRSGIGNQGPDRGI
jgi:hypothetical protein